VWVSAHTTVPDCYRSYKSLSPRVCAFVLTWCTCMSICAQYADNLASLEQLVLYRFADDTTGTCVCVFVCVCVCVTGLHRAHDKDICMCIYVCDTLMSLCVCVCVCVCIQLYPETVVGSLHWMRTGSWCPWRSRICGRYVCVCVCLVSSWFLHPLCAACINVLQHWHCCGISSSPHGYMRRV
jgi:hypothetical protein